MGPGSAPPRTPAAVQRLKTKLRGVLAQGRGRRLADTVKDLNLRCVFCQNFDISQDIRPRAESGATAAAIAAIMLSLQRRGCHNINFVTPEHVVPQIVEAVAEAVDRGLRLPIVYNTSAYDALESLALMDGIVDIYMPDFKYWSNDAGYRYLKAADYPDAARAAIKAMHEQVGPLALNDEGLARRGLLIPHLVLPGGLEETRRILEWIARELGVRPRKCNDTCHRCALRAFPPTCGDFLAKTIPVPCEASRAAG